MKLYCIKHCRQLSQSYKVAGACEYEISGIMLSPTARKTLVSNSSTGLKTLKVEIQSAQKLRERRKSEIMGGSRRGSLANRDVLNPQDIWKNSLRKEGPLPVTDELTCEEKFQKKMEQRRRKQNTPRITELEI